VALLQAGLGWQDAGADIRIATLPRGKLCEAAIEAFRRWFDPVEYGQDRIGQTAM
jgi:hypothetical protein